MLSEQWCSMKTRGNNDHHDNNGCTTSQNHDNKFNMDSNKKKKKNILYVYIYIYMYLFL